MQCWLKNRRGIYIAVGGGSLHGKTAFTDGYDDIKNNVVFTTLFSHNWHGFQEIVSSPSGVLTELGRLAAEKYGDIFGIMDFTSNNDCFNEYYMSAAIQRIKSTVENGAVIEGLVFAPCETLFDISSETENSLTAGEFAEFVYLVRQTAENMNMPVIVCMPLKAKNRYKPIIKSCTQAIENCTAAEIEDIDMQDEIKLMPSEAKAFGAKIFNIFCSEI